METRTYYVAALCTRQVNGKADRKGYQRVIEASNYPQAIRLLGEIAEADGYRMLNRPKPWVSTHPPRWALPD